MPSDYDVTACNRCGQPIRWTITAAGRRQAVNAEPNPLGNLAAYRDGVGTLRSRGLTADRPDVETYERRYMPHAATCTAPRPGRSGRATPRERSGVRPVRWQGWTR
ncbi:hypothetical protein AW27_026470 [Streptomyces sp. PCS3-D2]|uniref:hypothetical protein n=1 Tax=Streptomyces sp. PCS3-D2 TaxID=1460244 RepID=UPI00044BEA42|nr:hypothetical protein [Streptomyces sp. PCS3-D2]WKV74247.1 hypothetical protein AW27_023685 [Streptomyces sp. PCS3-D2]WKV74753.1 hypothetical protein AW27_026470 [Streptomyces sp. PCS3-D2]